MDHFLRSLIFALLCFLLMADARGTSGGRLSSATKQKAKKEAIRIVDQLGQIEPSPYWPDISPEQFVANLRLNITTPDSIHQGNRTNFCGYAVATYLMADYDPVGYVSALLSLYKDGQARLYGNQVMKPSAEVRRIAGTLENKGVLVNRPADQMWYLSLADHFRGFINVFDRRFNRGDENGLWAAMEQKKMYRLVQSLFLGNLNARRKGILINPNSHMADGIMERLKDGEIILYADDTFKTKGKKKHLLPKHYLVIKNIIPDGKKYDITYWDYGAVKKITLPKRVFERAARGYIVLEMDEMAYFPN